MLGITERKGYKIKWSAKFFWQSLFYGTVDHLIQGSLAGKLLERAATGLAIKNTKGLQRDLPDYRMTDKIKPKVVEYVVEEHVTPKTNEAKAHWQSLSLEEKSLLKAEALAQRPGYKAHLDFRIQNPSNLRQWISFAIPKGKLPLPGEKVQLVNSSEMHGNSAFNPPIIEEGYGQGLTRVVHSGKALVWGDPSLVHIILDRIDYPFVFVPTEHWKDGLLIGKAMRAPPYYDRPWRMVDITGDEKARSTLLESKDYYAQRKYDGGHYRLLVKNDEVHLVSRRPQAGSTDIAIDKVNNMPELHDLPNKGVKSLNIPVEVYSEHGGPYRAPHGYATAVLNSKPVRAAEMKAQYGNLNIVMLDVLEYNGIDYQDMPFADRLKMMAEVHKKFHMLEVPQTRLRPADKVKLRQSLFDKDLEGVIYRNKDGSMVAYKDKFKQDWDLKIIDVIPVKPTSLASKWTGKDGGGTFLLENGETVKIATDWMKEDAVVNKDAYIGRYAVVRGMSRDPETGIIRAPVLMGVHHDK